MIAAVIVCVYLCVGFVVGSITMRQFQGGHESLAEMTAFDYIMTGVVTLWIACVYPLALFGLLGKAVMALPNLRER